MRRGGSRRNDATMSNDIITAREVEAELPDHWWAENDGDDTVYAYAGHGEPEDVPASLTFEARESEDGDVWVEATWQEPTGSSGWHSPVDTTSGMKASVIDFVARKARRGGY